MHITHHLHVDTAHQAASRYADEDAPGLVLAMDDDTYYVLTDITPDMLDVFVAFARTHHARITRTILYATDQGGEPLTLYGTGETLLRHVDLLSAPPPERVVEMDFSDVDVFDAAAAFFTDIAFCALFGPTLFVRERGERTARLYLDADAAVPGTCYFYHEGRLYRESVNTA